jgi:hypothetical protein
VQQAAPLVVAAFEVWFERKRMLQLCAVLCQQLAHGLWSPLPSPLLAVSIKSSALLLAAALSERLLYGIMSCLRPLCN